MPIAAVFDLDGTIWDASKPVAESWERTLTRLLGKPHEITEGKMKSVMGMMMDEIAFRLIPEPCGAYTRKEAYEILVDEENKYLSDHPGTFFEGIDKAIREISAFAEVYILSNCQSGYIEAMLHSAPFKDSVKGILCYGDTFLSKKENLSLLIEKKNISKAVYIGDTYGDEEATHGNGLPFIHADYGYGKAENPEYVAYSPRELPELVRAALGLR